MSYFERATTEEKLSMLKRHNQKMSHVTIPTERMNWLLAHAEFAAHTNTDDAERELESKDLEIGALRNNNQNLQRQVYRMQMEMLAHDECASSKDTTAPEARYCIIGTSAYDSVFCDTFDEAVKHAGPMMARQNAPSKLLVVKVEGVVERTTPPITSRPLRPGELSMKGKSKSGEL